MSIRFFNTLSGTVEPFEPLEPGVARMYNCGPTVYDFAHIGNFRSFLLGDLLRRFLELRGFTVHQVMNLTDVGHMTEDHLADGAGQDKMELASQRLKDAKKAGRADVADPGDPYAVAEFYIAAFIEDARALGLKIAGEYPANMPRATEHVRHMQDVIAQLLKSDKAYVARDGAVYFHVPSLPEYGRLSGNTIERLHMGAGGRVLNEHTTGKRHPADFLLWKPDERHLMKWDSPWGTGYPGWHIECSAMSAAYLGDEFDIHTGGEDNIFPHHECEIAQGMGATGKLPARFWIHARHLMVDGRKMSKSRGNFHTVRDLFHMGHAPGAVRLALMATHYRQNANFTLGGIGDAAARMESWQRVLESLDNAPPGEAGPTIAAASESAAEDFASALDDDLNISAALAVVDRFRRDVNAAGPTQGDAPAVRAAFRAMDSVLGVLEWEGGAPSPDAEVEALIAQRTQARENRDFARADEIRDQLQNMGVTLEDGAGGTRWRRTGRG